MKLLHILILSLILLYSQLSVGQSLLEPGRMWSELRYDAFNYNRTNWYKLSNGTTPINEKEYFQLYVATDSLHYNWQVSSVYLREEDKIVYKLSEGKESKLYDFGLAVNDTMHFYDPWDYLYISRLDSVSDTLIYNNSHRLFYLSNFLPFDTLMIYPETWIEGIGSTKSIINDDNCFMCTGGNAYELLCMYQDDKLLYHSPIYADCYYHYVMGIDEYFNSDLQIYPNPVSDFLYFDNKNNKYLKIRIYTSTGNLVKELSTTSDKLDVSNLNQGIYYIRFKNNAKTYTGKFVKTN